MFGPTVRRIALVAFLLVVATRAQADVFGGGGSGSIPVGSAAGELSGTYPAPTIVDNIIRPLSSVYGMSANSASDQSSLLQTAATACVAAGKAGVLDMRAFQQLTTNSTINIGGCHLLLGAFTWTMNGTNGKVLTYDSGAEIAGLGQGRSILKLANGITQTAHAFQNVDRTVGARAVYVHDVTIDGNRSRTYSCVLASSITVNCPATDTVRAPNGANFLPTDVGKIFSGASIPALTTIASVVSPTQITLSAAATATLTETDTIGSTTGTAGAGFECGGSGALCQDITFERVDLVNWTAQGFQLDTASQRITVAQSRFINDGRQNFNSAAIYGNISATSDVVRTFRVEDNVIDSSATGSGGIKLSCSGTSTICDGVWVEHNKIALGDGGSARTLGAEVVTGTSGYATNVHFLANTITGPNATNSNIWCTSVGSSNGSSNGEVIGNICSDARSLSWEIADMRNVIVAHNTCLGCGYASIDTTQNMSTTGTSAAASNCLSSVASPTGFFVGTPIKVIAAGTGAVDLIAEITAINATVNCDGTGGAGNSFTMSVNAGAIAAGALILPLMPVRMTDNLFIDGISTSGDIQVGTGTSKGAVDGTVIANNTSWRPLHQFLKFNTGANAAASITVADNHVFNNPDGLIPDTAAITANTVSNSTFLRNTFHNWPQGFSGISFSGAGTGNIARGNVCDGASTTSCVVGVEPAASTGAASVATGSTDERGTLVASASVTTAASATLKGRYGIAPNCWCADRSAFQSLKCTSTTTVFTATAATDLGGDTIAFGCSP